MNVIVTGASGLLGRAVVTEFKKNNWKVLGIAHTRPRDDLVSIDLTDISAVSKIINEYKPHAIVHCAAIKDPNYVQLYPKECYPLNVIVPGVLAHLAAEVKAVFVFISSDYVFDGADPPYEEDNQPNPLNQYGMQKAQAEAIVIKNNQGSCILRVPVLYGGEESIGESAISSLIKNILENDPDGYRVSRVELRFPSHTSDIAYIIHELVQRKLQDDSIEDNIFQWCGMDSFTKYEMAKLIAQEFGRPYDRIFPEDIPAPGAVRPRNCQMICRRLFVLGITRHTSFVEGIREFSKFFE